jgi:hypothetical protein
MAQASFRMPPEFTTIIRPALGAGIHLCVTGQRLHTETSHLPA